MQHMIYWWRGQQRWYDLAVKWPFFKYNEDTIPDAYRAFLRYIEGAPAWEGFSRDEVIGMLVDRTIIAVQGSRRPDRL